VTPSTFEQPALTVAVGKQLQSDHQVHELPGGADDASDCSSLPAGFQSYSHPQTEVLVNTILFARIEPYISLHFKYYFTLVYLYTQCLAIVTLMFHSYGNSSSPSFLFI